MAYIHEGNEYQVVRSVNMFFEDMVKMKDILTENNETFIYIREGNTYRLIVPMWNKCFVYFGSRKRLQKYDNGKLKRYMTGLHLVAHVRRSVTSYIEDNNIKVTDKDKQLKSPRQDYYNIDSLAQAFCNMSYMVTYDVNRCYWNTAYQLGFISKEIYKKGLSKKEYKLACNISIGALAKKGFVQEYDTGVVTKQYATFSSPEYEYIYVLVKRKVEEFMDSFKMYDDAYAIFYVDCVFFNQNNETFKEHNLANPNFIIDHFKSYGYKSKKRYCQLVATDGQHIRIKWLEANDGQKLYSHYTLPIQLQHRFMQRIKDINPELFERIKENNKKSDLGNIILTTVNGECKYEPE